MSVSGFRFRAQAALDLRRREDERAMAALARAEAGLRAAMTRLRETEARAAEARAQCAGLLQQTTLTPQYLWYRSWILRLDRERGAAASAVAAREKERARAAAERARTHQRVEALDRFREKSQRAWAEKLAAEEQKHLDALATIRFVTGARTRAGG